MSLFITFLLSIGISSVYLSIWYNEYREIFFLTGIFTFIISILNEFDISKLKNSPTFMFIISLLCILIIVYWFASNDIVEFEVVKVPQTKTMNIDTQNTYIIGNIMYNTNSTININNFEVSIK